MGDVGDYWREHREWRRSQGLSNSRPRPHARKVHMKPKHKRLGFRLCSEWHWQIKLRKGLLDYWPSKDKWRYDGVTTQGSEKALLALVQEELASSTPSDQSPAEKE